jgi:hypothetical protein
MGRIGRMLSFGRRGKKGRASETTAPPTPSEPPPQPVSEILDKMKVRPLPERTNSARARLTAPRTHAAQSSAIGTKTEYKLHRSQGQPLGLGLAMDATEGSARAIIYAVRDNSIAKTAGLPSNTFLTSVDGKQTTGLGLDDVQRLISDAVISKEWVTLEVAEPASVTLSAAEAAVAQLLAEEGDKALSVRGDRTPHPRCTRARARARASPSMSEGCACACAAE